MFINARIKVESLVMNGLADVDGFKICIQVCLWLGFPHLVNIACDYEIRHTDLFNLSKYFTMSFLQGV